MTLKLWHTLSQLGLKKKKKVLTCKRLIPKSKGIPRLEMFIRSQPNCYHKPKSKSLFEKQDFRPYITSMLRTQHPKSYKVNMNFPNLGPLCCMPRPKMMRTSWTQRGRLQYILAKGLLQKKMMIMKCVRTYVNHVRKISWL